MQKSRSFCLFFVQDLPHFLIQIIFAFVKKNFVCQEESVAEICLDGVYCSSQMKQQIKETDDYTSSNIFF